MLQQRSKKGKKCRISATQNPEKDLRNLDIRNFTSADAYGSLPQCKNQPQNEGEQGNRFQKLSKGTRVEGTEKELPISSGPHRQPGQEQQLRMTDSRLKGHIPPNRLGIFNFKPEDPDRFWKKSEKGKTEGADSNPIKKRRKAKKIDKSASSISQLQGKKQMRLEKVQEKQLTLKQQYGKKIEMGTCQAEKVVCDQNSQCVVTQEELMSREGDNFQVGFDIVRKDKIDRDQGFGISQKVYQINL